LVLMLAQRLVSACIRIIDLDRVRIFRGPYRWPPDRSAPITTQR